MLEVDESPPQEVAPPAVPMAPPRLPPAERVVVRRVRRRHVRRHGSWKVAFADFATALMALFMVLWLMGSNAETKAAIAEYFSDPDGIPRADSSPPSADDLARQIQEAMLAASEFEGLEDQIEVSVSAEGLRIELLETDEGTFFENGGSRPTELGRSTITAIAGQLAAFDSPVVIEGHTDATPYPAGHNYSNWELSTDRANAARRLLLTGGIPVDRIAEVRGFAATRLRAAESPEDASNRRVSLIAQF